MDDIKSRVKEAFRAVRGARNFTPSQAKDWGKGGPRGGGGGLHGVLHPDQELVGAGVGRQWARLRFAGARVLLSHVGGVFRSSKI